MESKKFVFFFFLMAGTTIPFSSVDTLVSCAGYNNNGRGTNGGECIRGVLRDDKQGSLICHRSGGLPRRDNS